MTQAELIRLIDGPLAAYLGGDVSYGKFVELLNEEFPELAVRYFDLYPRLFNCHLAGPEEDEDDEEKGLLPHWDFAKAAEAYLKKQTPSG